MKKVIIIFLIILFLSFNAHAESTTPIQVSLGNPFFLWLIIPPIADWAWEHPIQIFPKDWDVYGMRLSLLHSINKNVSGLDVGLVPVTLGNQMGLQIGYVIINNTMKGVQVGIGAAATGDIEGIQLSGFFNGCKNLNGLQISLANMATYSMSGAQLGLVGCGVTNGNMTGSQIGFFVNQVNNGKATGLQFGLFNYAKSMKGIQIGLINIIEEGPLYICPIFNASF